MNRTPRTHVSRMPEAAAELHAALDAVALAQTDEVRDFRRTQVINAYDRLNAANFAALTDSLVYLKDHDQPHYERLVNILEADNHRRYINSAGTRRTHC